MLTLSDERAYSVERSNTHSPSRTIASNLLVYMVFNIVSPLTKILCKLCNFVTTLSSPFSIHCYRWYKTPLSSIYNSSRAQCDRWRTNTQTLFDIKLSISFLLHETLTLGTQSPIKNNGALLTCRKQEVDVHCIDTPKVWFWVCGLSLPLSRDLLHSGHCGSSSRLPAGRILPQHLHWDSPDVSLLWVAQFIRIDLKMQEWIEYIEQYTIRTINIWTLKQFSSFWLCTPP